MRPKRRFPNNVVDSIRTRKILAIRAGSKPHRFIGIWAVVVERRVFVRSWSIKSGGWYQTFRREPTGAIRVEGRRIGVRAVSTRSKHLINAVNRAYKEKYSAPGSIDYVMDMCRAKSRATTTELTPL